jgi:hypothetical protein
MAIKEMQVKTTPRFHLIPVRLAIIKNTTNKKCCKGLGRKETSHTAGGNVSWYNHSGKQCGSSLKN